MSSLAACGTALMRHFPKTRGLALKTDELMNARDCLRADVQYSPGYRKETFFG